LAAREGGARSRGLSNASRVGDRAVDWRDVTSDVPFKTCDARETTHRETRRYAAAHRSGVPLRQSSSAKSSANRHSQLQRSDPLR